MFGKGRFCACNNLIKGLRIVAAVDVDIGLLVSALEIARRGGETLLINLELFGRGNRGKDRSRKHDKEKNCKQFSHFEKSFFF